MCISNRLPPWTVSVEAILAINEIHNFTSILVFICRSIMTAIVNSDPSSAIFQQSLVDTLIDNQQIKDIVRNTSNLNDDHHPRDGSQEIMTGAKKLQLGELITNKLKWLDTVLGCSSCSEKRTTNPFILYFNIVKIIRSIVGIVLDLNDVHRVMVS